MLTFDVYQSTWQGNQKQYTTPRTNKLLHSDDLTQASWIKTTGVTETAAGLTGPDGTTSGGTLVYSGIGGAAGGVRASQALGVPALGTVVTSSIWLKAAGALSLRLSNGFATVTVAITTSWQQFSVSGTADGVAAEELALSSPAAVNTAFTADYAFAQLEEGPAETSYIATVATPVTVTDYAFNSAKTAITFGVAPISAAVITGEYANATVFAIGTGDGATATFAVPGPSPAPLPIPPCLYSDGVPGNGFAITPSDSANLAQCTRRIYAGGSGALKVVLNRDTAATTFQVTAGKFYDLAVKQVLATGTTATGLIGLS